MAKKKGKAQPRKRGVKGYFTGSRLDFLDGYRDEYVSLRGKDRGNFWHKLYEDWWKTYPWCLADNEEPPTGDIEKMKALSHVGGDHALKSGVEKRLRQRVSGWFSYRATVQNSHNEGGVWFHVLKHIHEQAGTKPRCRSVHQQFMLENPEVVNNVFVELHGEATDLTQVQKMNYRNDIARNLVKTTYSHLAGGLADRAKETHERELKEWGLGLDEIGEAEDVQLARDSLFSAVHPLLKFIGRYSGCYVTLLASGASTEEDGKAYFSTVHYFPEDRPRRKNWTEYDEEAFKSGVARPFVKYIHWMEGSEDKEPTIAKRSPDPTSTAVPSPHPSSTLLPHQPIGASRLSAHKADQGQGRKRRITSPEFSDEEDIDMTIEDNSSSGSSADPDEFPVKRARRSTIVTRRSKATATLQTPTTTTVVSRDTRSPSVDTGVEVSTGSTDTSDVDETTVDPAPGTPTPPPLSPPGMDIDSVGQSSLDTNVPERTTPLHIQQTGNTSSDADTEPTPESPDMRIAAKLEIPDFLIAKQDIYSYLVNVNEPGFKTLLNNYIAFELADCSGFRGNLPTTHRPKAVAWWLSRARPDRLPPYDSLTSFSKTIAKWWIFIQPVWRRPVLECGKTSRDEGYDEIPDDEERWERLYQPGINGLLNVVILAYWWAKILEERGESADAAYHWFVADVTWVLSQLIRVAGEGFSP